MQVGVEEPIERVNKVYRLKTEWRLPDLQGEIESSAANYKSAEDHSKTLYDKLTLMEEVQGRVGQRAGGQGEGCQDLGVPPRRARLGEAR